MGVTVLVKRKGAFISLSSLRPWQTRTDCCGHIVADTNVSPFARARNICCGHKFCVRDTKNVSDFVQKHFVSATNVSQFVRARKRHEQQCYRSNVTSFATAFKAMLHEATSLATCNATMTNKKPFKLQKGCYTQATFLAALRKVEGRSTFLATRNATIAVAKWGVTREFFLATCNATFVACKLQEKLLRVTWP